MKVRHGRRWARRCRLPPFKLLAKTITERQDSVIRGMLDGLSNAYVEAMNGLLRQARTAARCFRFVENFIAIACLRMSKLKHFPHPLLFPPSICTRTHHPYLLKLTSTGDREGQVSQHDIGIMVDAVSEVLDIPGSEIEPPPSFGARIRADFIFGMGKFVIILNINEVLSVEEIAQLTGTEGALEVSVVGAA